MGDGDAAAELGVVFDIVDQEGCSVQFCDDRDDDFESVGGDLEPDVEGGDELRADVFAGMGDQVVVRTTEDLRAWLAGGGGGESWRACGPSPSHRSSTSGRRRRL